MKAIGSQLFSIPKPPPRTPVPSMDADAFVDSEKPASIVAPAPAPKAGMARLSVDVPCSTLRALKIRAIERGQTVREYVLAMLDREGL